MYLIIFLIAVLILTLVELVKHDGGGRHSRRRRR